MRGLLLWEVAPVAVVAGLAGTAVGLALPLVLLPMAELRPFTGGVRPPALTVDPTLAAVVVTAGVLAVALATALAGRRADRTDPVRVLREGDRS